jgi:hypothetical protein
MTLLELLQQHFDNLEGWPSRRVTKVYVRFEDGSSIDVEPGGTIAAANIVACARCGRVGHVAQRDSVDPDLPGGRNCRIAIGQQEGELSPPRRPH